MLPFRVIYRFCKQYLYFNNDLTHSLSLQPKLIPNKSTNNIQICIQAPGATKDFCALITSNTIDYQFLYNTQSFPLYYFEERKIEQKSLFDL